MGTYADLTDCVDPVVSVEEIDLSAADRVIRALLRNKGIAPEDVTDPEGLALLRELAVAEATANAARRGAVEGDSALWKKWDAYSRQSRELGARCDRESLGLASTGTGAAGYGSIPLGRS